MTTPKEIKISFVIPAYNEERGIGACVGAITAELARNPIHAEIIVVDNASTDATYIAAEQAGATVLREPRKGTSFARHSGFLHAKGEFIANIDADTLISPGWIQKALREFERHPNLVALSGPYIYHDLPRRTRVLIAIFYGLAFLLYAINRYVLNAGSMAIGGNFIARRAALEKIGGYNTSLSFYGDDTDIAHRLNRIGEVRFTPRLAVHSSGRRLAREGIVRMGVRYTMNYFWITFFKKPYTKRSIDVR